MAVSTICREGYMAAAAAAVVVVLEVTEKVL